MRGSMIVKLRDFERVLFFTGAGLSSESGIPTYRGTGGMWTEYDYREYACQAAFERNPEHVWDFHDKRRAAVAKCDPNRAHDIIAGSGHPVVTQNIDGLHTRSGAREVVELHGCLWRVRCDPCDVIEPDFSLPMNPRKHVCGAYWRPDIVWFEDSLEQQNLKRARALLERCDPPRHDRNVRRRLPRRRPPPHRRRPRRDDGGDQPGGHGSLSFVHAPYARTGEPHARADGVTGFRFPVPGSRSRRGLLSRLDRAPGPGNRASRAGPTGPAREAA